MLKYIFSSNFDCAFNYSPLFPTSVFHPILTFFFYPICRFLLQCLEDLDASLRKLNSRLFVIRGQPANVFPRLFKVSTEANCPPS